MPSIPTSDENRSSPEQITSQTTHSAIDDEGLYDMAFVCRFFGGSKPLHPATIYRGIAEGRYPRPVHPSPNTNRWVGRPLKQAKQAILDAPREPLRLSPRKRGKGSAV